MVLAKTFLYSKIKDITMKLIDYNPEIKIPPIKESYINDKIVLSLLRSNGFICISMAVSIPDEKTKFWKGSDIYSNSITSFRDSVSNSLLGIMIKDYRSFGDRVSFVVIESFDELQNFITKFRPEILNVALLNMLNERGHTIFEQ